MQKLAPTATALILAAALLAPPVGAQGTPSITILSPKDRTTVAGSQLVIQTTVKNFALDPVAIGTAPKAGEGHWHLYVDGKLAGLSADGVISIPNDAYPTLTAGSHVIKVDLHNNNHTSVEGAKGDQITVRVAKTLSAMAMGGHPGVKFLWPTDGATVPAHTIVRVSVTGLKLDPVAVGTAPKAGEGHWHLYVDGKLAGLSASSVADATLTPGSHVLKVSLHNNDHTPVAGASSSEITVHVK
ncbi:MAG TPA: hypothetical protein VKV57_06305 [bacterium]|nr:hypothetical protein [bacterium]